MRSTWKRPLILLAAVVWVLASGCSGGCRKPPPPGGATGEAVFPKFALGVEYTEAGLGQVYGASGVRWAKTRLEAFSWGNIEPKRPVGGVHQYDWSCTDALVADYQGHGITHLQSYLGTASSWASVSGKDVMPKPEYLDDYAAFVGALIERYDADGTDDMPGLLAPVSYWVVGGEWTGFWGSGNAEDYLELLSTTDRAARAADPQVRLGAIPFFMFDVFGGDQPTDEQIAQRLKDPPPAWRNSTAGMNLILDRPDLFDFVDLHSLADYTEVPPMLRWMRAQMQQRGYQRPIWIDDATPIGILANFRLVEGLGWPNAFPVTEANRSQLYSLLLDVANRTEPAYSPAFAWVSAQVATGLVKKGVTALGEGAAGIQMGNTEDWMSDDNVTLRNAAVGTIGAAATMGLVEVNHGGRYGLCDPRTSGAVRPGYRNLSLLVEKLGPEMDGSIRPADLGGTTRGYVYQRAGATVWIVWNEDRVLQLPGEVEPSVTATIPIPAGVKNARLTWAVTDLAAPAPVVQVVPVRAEGGIEVALTWVPVFIEQAN